MTCPYWKEKQSPTARYISFIMIALMGNIFFDLSYIVVFALLVLHPLVLLINLFCIIGTKG